MNAPHSSRSICCAALLALSCRLAPAGTPDARSPDTGSATGPQLVFADSAEGRRILTTRDEFIRCMSPFDRAARLKTDREVSEKEFLEFVGRQTLDWTPEQTQKVSAAFAAILPRLTELLPELPRAIVLVKTTGSEEGGTAYTRTNAIVIPEPALDGPSSHFPKLLAHEAFHIATRADPSLRERTYASIGFHGCDDLSFPDALKARRITNPDAPRNDHCIRLDIGGKPVWTVPILVSVTEKYDTRRGGDFFNYLAFVFLAVDRPTGGNAVTPIMEKDKPRLLKLENVSGFYEQVGDNTQYVIHPEEILADNFSLLVLGTKPVASPGVLEKIRAALRPPSASK